MDTAEIFQPKWEAAGSYLHWASYGTFRWVFLGKKSFMAHGRCWALHGPVGTRLPPPLCLLSGSILLDVEEMEILSSTYRCSCIKLLQGAVAIALSCFSASRGTFLFSLGAKQQKYALRLKHALGLAALAKMQLLNYKGWKSFQSKVKICQHREALN